MFDFDLSKVLDQFVYHPKSPLLFSSGLFLFLAVVFYGVYAALLNKERLRLIWVVVFSLYFYYKCAGIYWVLHVVIVVVDYHLAIWIDEAKSRKQRLGLLVVSLVVNLGMLVYFKYTNYLLELWASISNGHFKALDIFLPAGISFFTFQSLSYTIDVYRKQLKPLDSILDYAFFVTFFPQMLAGPIVRAADFLPQIHRAIAITKEEFGRGVFLICIGMFKKVVISDFISFNFVDRVFLEPAKYTGLECLTAVYGYALQIYCDFSGYSDMAIGLALLMGFTFPINFLSPYQSLSVTEFWRRWHISLSTWLRDYLYIPLGGNRHGTVRTYVNLMLTMILGGLWHGAANRFIIWGLLHGLALAVERWAKKAFRIKPNALVKALGWFWTFHFVCFGWIYFRASSLETVNVMLQQIFFAFNPQIWGEFVKGYAAVLGMMVLGYMLHFAPIEWEKRAQSGVTAMPLLGKAVLVTLFAIIVMQMRLTDVQPFIYFQF